MDDVDIPLLLKKETLPDEKLLNRFGANALLPLYRDAGGRGLKPYVLGASTPRKVLGMLYLTNYRLKFKPIESIEDAFSLFLPAIAEARDVSRFLVRKCRLTMQDGTFIEFIRWGIPSLIDSVNRARNDARTLDWHALGRDIASAGPDQLGAWSVLPDDAQPTGSTASAG
ncbi:hypothetical protein [Pseudorhodoplanes sp.]|uniref:hypothetical protein n=1 Tax=Pseudorhodoplanes sp. TaxID=1934341 RepID=UPI00391AC264